MVHRLSPKARADLDDIWEYIAGQSGSEVVADRQIDFITDRFYLLATHPRLGRARDGDLGTGRRSFSAGQYIIVYRIVDKNVLILRVAHAHRDIQALFGWRED